MQQGTIDWTRPPLYIAALVASSLPFYLVFGDLASAGSVLISNPLANCLAIAALTIILADLEGLEVAVASVRLLGSDSRLPEIDGRTETTVYFLLGGSGSRRIPSFLAGRQLLLITVVVLVAGLLTPANASRFPVLNAVVPSLVSWLLLVGVPQALIIGWLCQILPKIVAEAHPFAWLRAPLQSGLVRICVAIGASPLAVLPTWLKAMVVSPERRSNRAGYGWSICSGSPWSRTCSDRSKPVMENGEAWASTD